MADKNICRTKRLRLGFGSARTNQRVIAMIDRQMMESELERARIARREAEAALLDVDDMIRELQHFQPGRQRVVFSIAGFEPEFDREPVAA